jgi:hypothetical protein
VKQELDLTLEEIQRRLLAELQHKAGRGSVWRFFDRHGKLKEGTRSGAIGEQVGQPDVQAVERDHSMDAGLSAKFGGTARGRVMADPEPFYQFIRI